MAEDGGGGFGDDDGDGDVVGDDDVDGCLCGKSAKNACYELIEFPQTIGQQESSEREKLQYFSYSSILFIPVTHLTIHDIHFYETFLSLI